MKKQTLKNNIHRLKAAVSALVIAAVLLTGNPALARLDELIMEDAPYLVLPGQVEWAEPAEPAGAADIDHYLVQPGDTLTVIARRNGLSLEELAGANRLKNQDLILAGQVLRVPRNYTVHRVQLGETLTDIARKYGMSPGAVATSNDLARPDYIQAGQELVIPRPRTDLALEASSSRGVAVWPFEWPVLGTITSPFGMRLGRIHEGIDIAAEEGTPIRTAAPGRVVFSGPRGTYGLTVIIDHGGGMRTLYAHCSRLLVKEGDYVREGGIIALVGNTGASRGPHLHLEVLKDGAPMDPMLFLRQEVYYG